MKKQFSIDLHKVGRRSFIPDKISKSQNVKWWTGCFLRTSDVCLPFISLRSAKGCRNESATVPKGNETPLSQATETSFSLGGEIYYRLSCFGWWPQSVDQILSLSPVEQHQQQPNYFRVVFIFLVGLMWVRTCLFHLWIHQIPNAPGVRCIRWSDICSYSLKSKQSQPPKRYFIALLMSALWSCFIFTQCALKAAGPLRQDFYPKWQGKYISSSRPPSSEILISIHSIHLEWPHT